MNNLVIIFWCGYVVSFAVLMWLKVQGFDEITLSDVFESVVLSFVWLGVTALVYEMSQKVIKRIFKGKDFGEIVIWRKKKV